MLRFARIACLTAWAVVAQTATLEYLSLDDMTAKSTAIVRGRVLSSSASFQGPLIYTHFTVQVLERWKGPDAAQLDVVVPGGAAQGLRQTFSGTPRLAEGSEYILFLWTGTSGLTHVIGLSQGIFTLENDAKSELMATRAASTEAVLDPKTGGVVTGQPVRLRLGDLRSRVRAVSERGGRTR
jgi:hypothetical protein